MKNNVLVVVIALGLLMDANRVGAQSLIGKPAGSFFAILARNADNSARWYQDALGFSVIRKSAGPRGSRTIMMEESGTLLEIIEVPGSFALDHVTRKKWDSLQGIKKVGVVVEKDSFDAIYQRLVARGTKLVGDIFTDEGLHMRSYIACDNDGNLVQFFTSFKGLVR